MKSTSLAVLLGLSLGTQAFALDCSRSAGSLPESQEIPIEHIVVIMQENHSFDNYFGSLAKGAYKGEVEGLTQRYSNHDKKGRDFAMTHAERLCMPDPVHNWNAMHSSWDRGRNDGFAKRNGKKVMTYFDQNDIPYYYALADRFAIADHFFASVLTQTYPNRMFLLAASAYGQVRNIDPKNEQEGDHKTIFDELDAAGVSWKYYPVKEDYIKLFGPTHARSKDKIVHLGEFKKDLEANTLPHVVFLESSEDAGQDEHPAANIQIGQAWVADKINAVMKSAYWPKTVVFLVYDEGGGFYDHVAPPEACAPDETPPHLEPGHMPGDYKRLGFRVPFIAISPFAKQHFVSHKTYEHTSILKFIETKFKLPALTRRDANADALLDLFDFKHAALERGPLPVASIDPEREKVCPRVIGGVGL